MKQEYIISIDQSTQGTKALLFDCEGKLLFREDLPHKQLVNEQGWVSHDLWEIRDNTIRAAKLLMEKASVSPGLIAAVGISNQRETTAMWDRKTGEPLEHAVVWQCGRAAGIVRDIAKKGFGSIIREKTGIPLSAYFPAAKMAWLLQKNAEIRERAESGEICLGTIDSWLLWQLTQEHVFKTDYSNASRTQLMNLQTLGWDEELAEIFGIPMECLPQICDSDSVFGYTLMGGLFEKPVPICAVLGDSHAALFGQGCLLPGMSKATYGTGSSLMMNIGEKPTASSHGVVTSLAWKRRGRVEYVLEGNLNYTGAVITWLKEDMKLIQTAGETEELALSANPADETYLVWDVPENFAVDHAIECVGGDASQKAIDQIIDIINPEGTISILGVSEYAVPINTRMVLEKGLRIFGSSRSGRKDFEKTVEMYQEYPEILGYLSNIVGAQVEVHSIEDMTRAFELDIQKMMGKTIMIWNK